MIEEINNSSPVFEFAKNNRIPISCTVELTENCVFKCPHCFVEGIGHHVLSYEDFVSFIDQFKKMGGVFLTLTGGEVLTHPRFSDIYKYAYELGLSVSVFSNGYLVTPEIIKMFAQMPPSKIEISLYGASNEKYKSVTKLEDAFERVINNIDELIQNGVRVHLKTTLFNAIYSDFDAMKAIAESRGVPFRYDFKLLPRINGEMTNLEHQVSPKKIIAIEKKEKLEVWKKNYPAKVEQKEHLFGCGAARYSCFLGSRNELRMCGFATFSNLDMNQYTLAEAWKEFEKYTMIESNITSKCRNCDKAKLCDICPMWGYVMHNDTNMLGREVEIHCRFAEERVKELSNA